MYGDESEMFPPEEENYGEQEGGEEEEGEDTNYSGAPRISNRETTYTDPNQGQLNKFAKERLTSSEERAFKQIIEKIKDIKKWTKQQAYYKKFQEFYFKLVNVKLTGYDVGLILYDEVEYFKDWDDPLFNYPF